MPEPRVGFAIHVNELTSARPLAHLPVSDVVVAIGVDEPSESVVDVVFKLPFVDYVVELFPKALSSAVCANLAHNELIVLWYAEW